MPSVAATRAWVSPRVNSAEPWARGRYSTSDEMGRISFTLRPSTRMPFSTISRRTSAFSTFSKASRTLGLSVSSAPTAATTSSNTASMALARASFSCTERACSTFALASSFTRATRAGSAAAASNAMRGLAALPMSSFCIRASTLHCSKPKASASSILSSAISLPPDSTMRMASSVPAITISSGEAAACA